MYLYPDNPAGADPKGNVFAMPAPADHPGCNCGCHKQPRPMGALSFDGTGLFGTGLFSAGLDLSQWTIAEWIAVGFGIFAVYSMFSSTKRGAQKVGSGYRYVTGYGKRRRRAAANKLRRQADRLESGDD